MPQSQNLFSLSDVVISLSKAIDLISPTVARHHAGVGSIAFALAGEMGLPAQKRGQVLIAGLLHDIGALSLAERLDAMAFETADDRHAVNGYRLLKPFHPFLEIATTIRYHHASWEHGQTGIPIPLESHLIHLADRVDVLMDRNVYPLHQISRIMPRILDLEGTVFHPEVIAAFQRLAEKESFWLDAGTATLPREAAVFIDRCCEPLTWDSLLTLSGVFSKLIDFRSRFTSTHSAGVSAVATTLARLFGFSGHDLKMMTIAGNLHDLGKIAVPTEILEKPGKLSQGEVEIIKSHTYHTWNILEPLTGMEEIMRWGALHHERLDGHGYPFHASSEHLTGGSRIMSVADVLTALTEDRPYRDGMDQDGVLGILAKMTNSGALDECFVGLVCNNYSKVDGVRREAQERASTEYATFQEA